MRWVKWALSQRGRSDNLIGRMATAEARVERTGERVIVSECKTTLGTWWILGGLGVVAGGGSGGSGFGYSLSGAGFGYAITGFLTGFIIAGRERHF